MCSYLTFYRNTELEETNECFKNERLHAQNINNIIFNIKINKYSEKAMEELLEEINNNSKNFILISMNYIMKGMNLIKK